MNPNRNPSQYSPLTLAFLGDAVYSQRIRERILLLHGSMPSGKLHQESVRFVSAHAQAKLFDRLEGVLTEEEEAILKRGRNATGVSAPRHTEIALYRKATGVEALFGWLRLSGKEERLDELTDLVFESEEDGGQTEK